MNVLSKGLRVACRNTSVLDEVASLQAHLPKSPGVTLKWGFRRVPLSRGRHHGGYVCAFVGQPLLRVESNLERQVVKTLVTNASCLAIATQPVTMYWTWRGIERRYTPDVLVIFKELPGTWRRFGMERISLIEVKPMSSDMDDDLWYERALQLREALNVPLVRLPAIKEIEL
jgi:hypothetical protein